MHRTDEPRQIWLSGRVLRVIHVDFAVADGAYPERVMTIWLGHQTGLFR